MADRLFHDDDDFITRTRRRINEQQRGGTSTKAPTRSQILQSTSPIGRQLAVAAISPFVPRGVGAAIGLGERLTRPSPTVSIPVNESNALEQITSERQAFEDAALVSLRQSGQIAGGRGQAQGQALASAGLAGSPLATSQIANQRRLADQSALDRITLARFGLESNIAGREFQQSVLDQQQAQFDRQQRNAFIAIGAEIGFDLIDDFGLYDELKDFIGDLFSPNELGTNIDILPGTESDLFA